jgi:hypothetical protein
MIAHVSGHYVPSVESLRMREFKEKVDGLQPQIYNYLS